MLRAPEQAWKKRIGTAFEWYFERGEKPLGRDATGRYTTPRKSFLVTPRRECSSSDSWAHLFLAKWVGLVELSWIRSDAPQNGGAFNIIAMSLR